MITKSVVKDYVAKRCPYLTKCELEDKTLIELLKIAAASSSEYEAILSIDKEMSFDKDDDGDEVFNIIELLNEHPKLRTTVETILNSQKKNPVEKLVEKYTDKQLLGELARKYVESQYKAQGFRCDVDQYGNEILNQKEIVDNTAKALADPRVKIIFEGQFEVGNVRARFDILIKDKNGWYTLLEAKGTNSVCTQSDDKLTDKKIKDKYLYDLAFQYYVYKKCGLNFNRIGFITLNRYYQLGKHCYPVADSELSSFFHIKTELNLKEETISILEYIDSRRYVNKNGSSKPQQLIDEVVQEIEDIATDKPVPPKKCYSCRKGPICPFLTACFPDAKEGNSIFKLTNWGDYGGSTLGMKEIIDERGIDKISDIPDDIMNKRYPPTKTSDKTGITKNSNAFAQIVMEKGIFENKYVLNRDGLEQELKRYFSDNVDYLLFFDFESFQDPFPLVEHAKPYKQIVSQYSMHVVSKNYDLSKHDFDKGIGGGITHKEFIGNPDDDNYENPSIRLYQTLFKQLEDCDIDPYSSKYRVIVFNKSFEETRMKEFVEEYPGLCDSNLIRFVDNFKNNIIDLLEFFTKGLIYSREFYGKGSLKVVQPKLIEDADVQTFYKSQRLMFNLNNTLDYHKGNSCLVFNGAICLDLYKSLLIRHHKGEKDIGIPTSNLLKEALAYCKIDSWGTVIIFDIIKNVSEGKLKLDAHYL